MSSNPKTDEEALTKVEVTVRTKPGGKAFPFSTVPEFSWNRQCIIFSEYGGIMLPRVSSSQCICPVEKGLGLCLSNLWLSDLLSLSSFGFGLDLHLLSHPL